MWKWALLAVIGIVAFWFGWGMYSQSLLESAYEAEYGSLPNR